MELLRVRERGQITISKALREQLGIRENSTLLAYVQNGRLILEPVPEPKGDLMSLVGLLPGRGRVDAKKVRREAQRHRAERRSEHHGSISQRDPRGSKEVAGLSGTSCEWPGQEVAAAKDPVGIET